jgi:hypothetical protein
MDIRTLRELCEKATDTELAAARTALLELLDEVEMLREEVRQLNKIATIAGEWLVEAVRRGE